MPSDLPAHARLLADRCHEELPGLGDGQAVHKATRREAAHKAKRACTTLQCGVSTNGQWSQMQDHTIVHHPLSLSCMVRHACTRTHMHTPACWAPPPTAGSRHRPHPWPRGQSRGTQPQTAPTQSHPAHPLPLPYLPSCLCSSCPHSHATPHPGLHHQQRH